MQYVEYKLHQDGLMLALPHVAACVKHCAYAHGDKTSVVAAVSLIDALCKPLQLDVGGMSWFPEHWANEPDISELETAIKKIASIVGAPVDL